MTLFPTMAVKTATIVIIIMVLSGLSLARNAVWESRLSFGTDVAKKSPRSSRAHNSLGNAYDEAGRFEEAVREYALAISLNPGHIGAHVNMGNAFQKLGMLPEAVQSYQSALLLHPDAAELADAYNGLGSAFLALGRPGEALTLLRQARVLRSGSANTHFNLGEAYAALGSYDDAIASFTDAITLDPQDPYAYYRRGMAFEKTGRDRDAVDDYQHAVMLKPDLIDADQHLRTLAGGRTPGPK